MFTRDNVPFCAVCRARFAQSHDLYENNIEARAFQASGLAVPTAKARRSAKREGGLDSPQR